MYVLGIAAIAHVFKLSSPMFAMLSSIIQKVYVTNVSDFLFLKLQWYEFTKVPVPVTHLTIWCKYIT